MVKQRFETTDRIALAIAIVMIIVGFAGLLLPEDFIVAHTSMRGKASRITPCSITLPQGPLGCMGLGLCSAERRFPPPKRS